MLSTAVVGCGFVGRWKHLPALDSHPRTELVAVCDAEESALERSAEEYGVTGYADVEEMLSAEAPDSVHVCTPPRTHLPIVRTVLSTGCSVLVEKPLALDADEAREMMRLAGDSEGIASVVHNKLFQPQVQSALRAVEAGRIGDVVSTTMLFSEPQNESPPNWTSDLPGGGLIEGLPHQSYLPLAFVGRLHDVSSVYTGDVTGNNDFGFDAVDVRATDVNNRLVSIQAVANEVHRDYLLVQGTEGELRVELLNRHVVELHPGSDPQFVEKLFTNNVDLMRDLGADVLRNGVEYGRNELRKRLGRYANDANGHHELIDRYVRAVESGGEPPVPLADGLDTARITERVIGQVAD